jgi:putative membrane protein
MPVERASIMSLINSDVWALCITPVANARALWSDWSLAPEILAPFLVGLALYTWGSREQPSRVIAFSGWAVLGLALFSPLCRLAAGLVSAHMIQLALMSIVAPALMAAGGVAPAIKAGAQAIVKWRGRPSRRQLPLTAPAFVYGAAIWLWHAPPIYNASLTNPALHIAVMFAIVLASIWFFHRAVGGSQSSSGAAILALLITMSHTGVLGAILTFAPQPLYAADQLALAAWGLTAKSDQQLAGLIMWAPSGLLYLIVALVVTARMIAAPTTMRTSE